MSGTRTDDPQALLDKLWPPLGRTLYDEHPYVLLSQWIEDACEWREIALLLAEWGACTADTCTVDCDLMDDGPQSRACKEADVARSIAFACATVRGRE